MSPEILGEATVCWILGAGLFVDEDRTGERQRLQSLEWIIGEQDPALLPNLEIPQAVPARAMARRRLSVRRVAVGRVLAFGSNRLRHLGRNGHVPQGSLHSRHSPLSH